MISKKKKKKKKLFEKVKTVSKNENLARWDARNEKFERWSNMEYAPSSLSTSFCNFCTDLSANSARASACRNSKNEWVPALLTLSRDLSSILKFLQGQLKLSCVNDNKFTVYYAYVCYVAFEQSKCQECNNNRVFLLKHWVFYIFFFISSVMYLF